MLLVADWAKLITDEKGKLRVLAVIAALSHQRAWPLLNILPFMPKTGSTYNAKWGTASTEKATRAMNVDFEESSPGVGEYAFPMRAAGGALKLDINMLGSGDTSGVLRAGLLTQKVIDIGARLNRMWFYGDKAAVAADEWQGANEFCADNGLAVGAGGDDVEAVISSDKLDEAVDLVPGANVILCNRKLARQVDNLQVGVQRTININEGRETPAMFLPSYKGIPILPVDKAPADDDGTLAEILPFDEEYGESEETSRITVARVGMDGVYGIHHALMQLANPRVEGAFEINDLNWFMAGLATDYPDSIAQVVGVLETAPEEEPAP